MINRVADKENAKQYMKKNGNHSGMIGTEILYQVISKATLAALTGVIVAISLGSGLLTAIVSVPFLFLNPIMGYMVYGMLMTVVILFAVVVGTMLRAPFEIAKHRYYLHIRKNNLRTSAISLFESFDFFIQFGLVAGIKQITICWFPFLLIIGGGLVSLILSLINIRLGIVLGGLIDAGCFIAAEVIIIYKELIFWPMEMVQADHPGLKAEQVMERCKSMTAGHIGDLLLFELSFWGWKALSVITGGIAGLVYATPYYSMTKALVYEELKGRPIQLDGIQSNVSGSGWTIGVDPRKFIDFPPPPPPFPPKEETPALVGVVGMYAGSRIQLTPNQPVVLGRDGTMAQIVFSQGAQKISRRHCEIMFNSQTQQYRVTDFSSNGTYANGSRLPANAPVKLPRGTQIALGDNNNVIRLV